MAVMNARTYPVQVDHIVTGSWSKKAAQEADKYCEANTAAKGDNKSVPPRDSWQLSDDAVYVHYCDNETIQVGCHCASCGCM
jgi:phosphoserine aminotransferase